MQKQIILNGKNFYYELTYKKVKNINLRIKSDGTINVSAGRNVSIYHIEAFMKSKADFIENAVEKFKNAPGKEKTRYFSEDELKQLISYLCLKMYPYYQSRAGIKYPEIKFKSMVSRWGSCHPKKCILTFNLNLMYAPKECVEYVVLHEFTHFLQPNHSADFYNELAKVCPLWQKCRNVLKKINIR